MLENSQVEPATAESGTSASRPATARAHLAGAVLRRHWLAAALLAAGLALRVLAQFAYRPALFYIDTSRYLYNAEGMDPVGYKGPLRAILFVANFGAVAAVQRHEPHQPFVSQVTEVRLAVISRLLVPIAQIAFGHHPK